MLAAPDDDIFVEIDKLLTLREWTPPPSPASLCGLCTLSQRPDPLTAGMLMKSKVHIDCLFTFCVYPGPNVAAILCAENAGQTKTKRLYDLLIGYLRI